MGGYSASPALDSADDGPRDPSGLFLVQVTTRCIRELIKSGDGWDEWHSGCWRVVGSGVHAARRHPARSSARPCCYAGHYSPGAEDHRASSAGASGDRWGPAKELQERELRTIELSSRLDMSANGVYTVTAKGPTARAATFLADAAAESLLNWDRGRALKGLQRAERSLRAQLAEIDRQLGAGDLDEVDRQTLIAARANTQRNLAQASIQTEGVAGSLELVAPAVEPLRPVAPRPTRNAVLAGLLTLLLGTGLAALRTVTDRTVRGEDDLLQLGFPVLGNIPRLRQRDIVMSGIVRAARAAGLYEAVGFLRVNLLSQLSERRGQRIMITSTAPGEGKSSLTATLADGLASSGQRVLVIDADLRRGTQQEVWEKYDRDQHWVQLTGEGAYALFRTPCANRSTCR